MFDMGMRKRERENDFRFMAYLWTENTGGRACLQGTQGKEEVTLFRYSELKELVRHLKRYIIIREELTVQDCSRSRLEMKIWKP